ncbi:MFS transporter, partial [Neisseria sp. P0015.S009]
MGFHYGFGAAAVGMAFGLLWFSRGRNNLPHTPAPNPLRPEKVHTALSVGVLLVLVVGSVIASGALNHDNFSRWL